MLVGKSGVNKTPKDTMTLALHVLTSAGFGKSYAFDGGVTKLTDGYTMVYRDALRIVLQNLFTSIVITSVSLPDFLLPKKIKEIKVAIAEFKKYMVDMVEEERSQIQKVDIEKDNLLSVLVRISEQEGGAKGRNGLSNDEIFGNLFIYNLAGHGTFIIPPPLFFSRRAKLLDHLCKPTDGEFSPQPSRLLFKVLSNEITRYDSR
jgi:hypothetical protein